MPVIPRFDAFTEHLTRLFARAGERRDGAVASYIPQLARVDPERFGVAVCTVDGRRWTIGDAQTEFSVQSCHKPMTYGLALEEHGEAHVHRFVGREPSGHGFNELKLNPDGRPHNPMINAGAIMTAALIHRDQTLADRFAFLTERWRAACGGQRVGFDNAVYLSERQTADRNYALAYFMNEHKAFPPGTNLLETLELYFQCCSIEVTAEALSVFAATLANGGVCPLTGEVIFAPDTVRDVLSLMLSCGMYDFSGEFMFTVGLPAKSGISGAIFAVIPGLLGVCTYAPRVDRHGNSVRGLAFYQGLVETFNVHTFDVVVGRTGRIDPRT